MVSALATIDRWICSMARLRNKEGLSAQDATRVFQDYHDRRKRPSDEEDSNEVLKRVLHFMETTSQKLDKIESDIGDLRRQVDSIIKHL